MRPSPRVRAVPAPDDPLLGEAVARATAFPSRGVARTVLAHLAPDPAPPRRKEDA